MSFVDPSRRLRVIAALGLAVATLYLVTGYLAARVRWIPSHVAEGDASGPVHVLSSGAQSVAGAIHVHTMRSHDSLGTDEEVARAARAAGLDFVILTDHRDASAPDSLWARPAKYSDGVLLVHGQEVSLGGDVGRVLVFGVDTAITDWRGGLDAFAGLLNASGGTGIVAHSRSPRIRDSWRPDSTPGIAGWETFDLADVGRARLAGPWVVYHLVTLSLSAPLGRMDRSLLRLYREGFEGPSVVAFDSMYARTPLTAVAGLDVHPKRRFAGRLLPDYRPFFGSLVNYVELTEPLPAEPAAAAQALAGSVAGGRVFISFGSTREAQAFALAVVAQDGTQAGIGAALSWQPGLQLKARFGGSAGERVLYRVIMDGRTQSWVRGSELSWPVPGPGAYRVEAYKYVLRVGRLYWNSSPWIFSNPIRVTPSS